MNANRIVGKIAIIALGLACLMLSAGLIMTHANSTKMIESWESQITEKDNTIASLTFDVANKTAQIETLSRQNEQLQTWLDDNVTILKSQTTQLQDQLESANSQIEALQHQVDDLTAIVNASNIQLTTLVFHVCEKGEGYDWGHLPDVNYTYHQLLTLDNNAYEILLLPEYMGNENWTETTAWLTENFVQIPIMLPVFEGGIGDYPVLELSINQISVIMEVCDILWLRFAEVISWHLEHNVTFPADYVMEILNFCRTRGLKLFWTEWKVDAFKAIQTYIAGFEDIVVVSFSTNSGDLEPADGFLLMNTMFQHWGASVQSWYWKTRSYDSELDMPISLLVQHALAAKNIGAEIIQFEPYWYFFDNGEARENLKLIEVMLMSTTTA